MPPVVERYRKAGIDVAVARGIGKHLGLSDTAFEAAGVVGFAVVLEAGALGAAEVGAEQSLVGVDDADERQLGKMMSFRQHLRADEDIGLALARLAQRVDHGSFALRAVTVDSHDTAAGKPRAQRFLESLGALSERLDDAAALIDALKNDPAPTVREDCAETLGKIGGKEAIAALHAALRDKNARARAACEDALDHLGRLKLPLPEDVYSDVSYERYKELRKRKPANLAAKMKEVNETKKLTRVTPAQSIVKGWVAEAKTAKPMITH